MEKIKRFSRNEKGCYYVVGDIHGCFTKLQQSLEKINFNPSIDRLFSVGDFFYRFDSCIFNCSAGLFFIFKPSK